MQIIAYNAANVLIMNSINNYHEQGRIHKIQEGVPEPTIQLEGKDGGGRRGREKVVGVQKECFPLCFFLWLIFTKVLSKEGGGGGGRVLLTHPLSLPLVK